MTAIEITSLDEIVFEGRNRAYGAYQLRKNQNRNFLIAMTIVFGTIPLAWGIETLVTFFAGTETATEIMTPFPSGEVNPQICELPVIEPSKSKSQKSSSSHSTSMFKITEKTTKSSVVFDPQAYEAGPESIEGSGVGDENSDDENDGNGSSQTGTLFGEEEPEKEQIQVVEFATFPGGDEKLEAFIKTNFDFPEKPIEEAVSGVLVLYFEIDEHGKTRNVKVIKSFPDAENLEREAIRVVSSMPDWTPKKINGKPVMTRREIQINCKL